MRQEREEFMREREMEIGEEEGREYEDIEEADRKR